MKKPSVEKQDIETQDVKSLQNKEPDPRDQLAKIQTEDERIRLAIGNKHLKGVPYELERVIFEAQVFTQQTITGIVETGNRLIAIKEYEGYGKWEKIVEERIGISRMTAWRFMAVAKRIGSCNTVLQLNAPNKGGVGKLYALLNVPDEELAEFDETGILKGATLEDINGMSVKEFKKLLAEKEDWKAKAKQYEHEVQSKYDTQKQYKEKLTEKEKKIAELEKKLEERFLPEDEKMALHKMMKERATFSGWMRLLERANLDGHSDEVRTEFLELSRYIHERAEVFMARAAKIIKGDAYSQDALDAAEEFQKEWNEDA